MSFGYITSNVCEDVVVCDPNPFTQVCLPVGYENFECDYEIFKDGLPRFGNYIGSGNELLFPVTFSLKKTVFVDDNGIQQERWLSSADGGPGNDRLSGIDLLAQIRVQSGVDVAHLTPSLYLGDLIHFTLRGGDGNDIVIGANNADYLYGGAGNDRIEGLGGDDTIEGNSGSDSISGGDGNDLIMGGTGRDTVWGGNDDDQIFGGDELDANGNDLPGDWLYGNDGNDNIYGEAGDDYIDGGRGNDWMSGGTGDDTIYGSSGDDCADGGAGDDYISMGSGNDIAAGGAGKDTLYGGSDDDRLDGGEGNDYVYGESGNDLVVGGAGDDYVYGGSGDDIVRGGTGEDVMYGGSGCDIFAFCEVSFNCSDQIRDFELGRDADQIDLTQLNIDSIRVEQTGFSDMVRLDLLVGGQAVQQILVESNQGADLVSVFDKDTAYAEDAGAIVRLGGGVMVDLPTTSVMVADPGGMFF